MKILNWNIRGLGNPQGIRTLCDLVWREALDILFLQETCLTAKEFEVCKFKLGFVNCLVVDSNGRKGGLALLWGRDISLTIMNYSVCHIDARVDDVMGVGSWYLKGIYGFPEVSQRCKTWDVLRYLNRRDGEAWMMIGDFNEVLHHDEKCGALPRPNWQINAFRDVVDECLVKDLGFKGNQFTWRNGRGGEWRICERLDRVLANQPWFDFFLSAGVSHGVAAYSDHSPIWVITEADSDHGHFKCPFRFEEIWVGEKGCEDIIKANWRGVEGGHDLDHIIHNIKECGTQLNLWNRNCFGNVQKQLKLARLNMEMLSVSDPTAECKSDHIKAREDFQKWLERDKVMW
ncbi:uncharacterized protein LOC122313683 [Carya illinoinensis]|uniref:uncharacterized protein LOC122313683 n=1 Tax=Carya illinoinensis TaxID=32201 RepID=UPI001C71AAE9|nr:uncharacterized protein LOC122313683 [Carya illinoinensis]